MTTHPHAANQGLACMEIWGGSQATETNTATPGLDIWVHSRPHDGAENGGDVHYLSLCGGGVITRMILADVSGHGVSAAEFGKSLRDLMRRNINRKTQDRLVKALNRQFGELARLRRFATAIVATYLTTSDTLTICNAGHPHPLWYRSERGTWSILKDEETEAVNLPLGIDDDTVYAQQEIKLSKGDLVLFYTDALTEAANPEGQMLGEVGLLGLVQGLEVSNPATVAQGLRERLHQYRGGQAAEDDQTFLLLHHNARGQRRLSFWEELNVYAKVLGLKRI